MKRNDWLLFGGAVAVGCLMLLFYWIFAKEGAYAVIMKEGAVTESYPLLKEQEVLIHTPYGINRMRIQGGTAFMIEADCPDKLCVRQKPIAKEGESLICLPHRLVVSVQAGRAAPQR